MSVLVDTSVWSDHFRRPNALLAGLVVLDEVLTHPVVIGELACGTLPGPRLRTLADMELLLSARLATRDEVHHLIEREQLFGLGCGFMDLSLLASTLITPGAALWTFDQRLSNLANRFGVGFSPAVH